MTSEVEFLIKIVKKASKIITKDFSVEAKGDSGDLVTSLDLKIEKYLIQEIKKKYPEFDIVSEEFNSKQSLTDNCFILDPIDGTVNFANHEPLWGIQVACRKNAQTVAAVIYLPYFKELYYADETGAYLNGKPTHVNPVPIKNCMYVVPGEHFKVAEELSKTCKISRNFGAGSVNFSWIASGKFHATSFSSSTPWDKEPGMFLVKQAGGAVCEEENLYIAACSLEVLNHIKKVWKSVYKNK